MQGNVVETLIGALVLVVAGVFLTFAYTTAGVRSNLGGYDVVAKFNRVDGLAQGSAVKISGIKVGSVTGQTLEPDTFRAVVKITLDRNVKLPDDTAAKIASEGLLGGNFLSIEPGGSDVMIKPGGEIQFTQGSVNLMDLIGQAIFSVTSGAGDKEKKAQ